MTTSPRSRLPLIVLVGAAVCVALWFLFAKAPSPADREAVASTPTTSAGGDGEGTRRERRPHRDRLAEQGAETMLRGRVETPEGKGAAGALVQLAWADGDEDAPEIVSNADGGFEVQLPRGGRFHLRASAEGFGPSAPVSETAAGADLSVELQLTTAGFLLSGRVTDVLGGVVEGAWLKVTPLGGTDFRAGRAFAARTGEDGRYAVGLSEGRYIVAIRHPEYSSEQRSLKVAGPREVDFSLTPMSSITGVVVDSVGDPVAGARVAYAEDGQGGGRTRPLGHVLADSGGAFRIVGLEPGVLMLEGSAPQLASLNPEAVAVGLAEERTEVRLVLAPAADVRGRVVAKGSGDPVRGAVVDAGLRSATSDDSGAFVLHGVSGTSVSLSARADGYLPMFDGLRLDLPAKDEVELALDPGEWIDVRVDPPVPATIRVEPDLSGGPSGNFFMGANIRARTGADGRAAVGPLPAQRWSLVVESDDGRGAERTVEVPARDEIVVELESRYAVRGRVVDEHGGPVAGATVTLRPRGGFVQVFMGNDRVGDLAAVSAEDGLFALRGVKKGNYDAHVRGRDGGELLGPGAGPKVVVDSADVDGLVIEVPTLSGVMEGTVVRGREGVADAWVTLEEVRPNPWDAATAGRKSGVVMAAQINSGPTVARRPTVTDERGRFEVGGLNPDAKYRIVVHGPAGSGRAEQAPMSPSRGVTVELEEFGAVEGRVTASFGPIEAGRVVLNGPSTRAAMLSSGTFDVDRLMPGPYRLEIRTESGHASVAAEVRAGETTSVEATLERWLKVEGRLVEQDGQPVVGAAVMMAEVAVPGSIELRRSPGEVTNVTGEDGSFEIHAGPGQHALVFVRRGDAAPTAFQFMTLDKHDVNVANVRANPKGQLPGPGDAPKPSQVPSGAAGRDSGPAQPSEAQGSAAPAGG